MLTGDSLFVGDVARPDLAVEAEEGARGLHASLQRLLELPDHVQVLPGHLGGSLCGSAAMSEAPGSTIGFERRFNALLQAESESELVERLTRSLKPQPPNFQRIVALNAGPLLTEAAQLEAYSRRAGRGAARRRRRARRRPRARRLGGRARSRLAQRDDGARRGRQPCRRRGRPGGARRRHRGLRRRRARHGAAARGGRLPPTCAASSRAVSRRGATPASRSSRSSRSARRISPPGSDGAR